MRPSTSTFLDALRIVAAFVVFANHCAQFWSSRVFLVTAPIAHRAVVVFFVLSGYVITSSTLARERAPRRFILARLSRLYSVVIPAVILTIGLQLIGSRLNPGFYAELSRGSDAVRYALTVCFLQNVWHLSASPPTNGPFWSLSYEFWYYALFGLAIFVRSPGARIVALAAVSALIGPNILLLMPCWLVGVGLFIFRRKISALLSKSPLPFAISAVAMLTAIAFLPPYPHDSGDARLFFSGGFLGDWVIAVTVGLTIASFDALDFAALPERPASLIRYFADHTFSLYLYHFPLIVFITAAMRLGHPAWWETVLAAACVLYITLSLGAITEAKRADWRRVFEWALDCLPSRKKSDCVGRA